VNRVEVLAAVSQDAGTIQLICRLLGFEGLREEEYYVRRGYDAFEHTALLMAGLLSQEPGEYHIVSQVKDALATAVKAARAGGIMQEWADSALHVSKAIRDAVGPQIRDAEIEDLCLDYVAAAGPALHGRAFVVVGAGVVGRGVVERWVAKGGSCDWYYHLNKPEVPAALSDRVRLLTLNQLRTHLAAAGVVVCTTSSEGYVLHKGHAPFFDLEHDVLVMDLSIPRNVEPALDKLTATLRVLDLDDLKRWYWRSAVDVTSIIDTGR